MLEMERFVRAAKPSRQGYLHIGCFALFTNDVTYFPFCVYMPSFIIVTENDAFM